MEKLGSLTPGVDYKPVYRRKDGRTFCMIEPGLQVEVIIQSDHAICQGRASAVDFDEEVEVIQNGVPKFPEGPRFWHECGALISNPLNFPHDAQPR